MPSHNGTLGRLGRTGRQAAYQTGDGSAVKQYQAPGVSARALELQQASAGSSAAPATRSTSVNADALLSLFECPVCFDYSIPPLLQCQSGHMVCSRCREKLSICPTCRASIGHIRNLAMEKVALTVSFPCRWADRGCEASLACSDKLVHEEVCQLRPYSCCCPGAACGWTGALQDVIPHLLDLHKSITTLQGYDIVFLATDISLPGAVDWVMLQSCFDEHFMLVLEKQEKMDGSTFYYAVVQYVGTPQDAHKFSYRLELSDPKQHRRLMWDAVPKSIHEGISSAFDECLMFGSSVAQLFADGGNLAINVTIRKKDAG